jgi:hypothetical protein
MSLIVQPLRGVFDGYGNFSILSEGISSINFNGSFGKTIVTKKVKDLKVGDIITSSDVGVRQTLPLMIVSFVHNASVQNTTKFYVYYLNQTSGANIPYVTGATTNINDVYFTGEEDITVEIEDPVIFDMGENGWAISKYGNALFSNVKMRGEIEATAGEISGILEIGPSMQLGTDEFLQSDPTRYYGLSINENNYFFTYSVPTLSYQIEKIEVLTDTGASGLSRVRINIPDTSDYVVDSEGSTDPRRTVVLYGLQGNLSSLNGSSFISAKGSDYIEVIRRGINNGTTNYSSALVKPQVGMINSNRRINISSIVVSDVPNIVTRKAVITAPNNNFEVDMLVEISGITSDTLLSFNGDYMVTAVSKPVNNPSLNTFTLERVNQATIGEYYKSNPGIGSTLAGSNDFGTGSNPVVRSVSVNEDSSKFKVGSRFNSMSYDSQFDKLKVTGEINARGGSFTDSVTVGSQAKVATISNKSIFDDLATITTSADHNFSPGDSVVISGVNSTFNGIYEIITTPTPTTFTYDKEPSDDVSPSSATGTATVGIPRDGTILVGYGSNKISIKGTSSGTTSAIFAGAGNYKNSDTGFFMDASGRFSLKDKLFFEDNDLTISGKITASTLDVGGSQGIQYNGTGTVYIGSNVDIAANVTVNGLQVGVSPSFLKIANGVSGTAPNLNDGIYINSNNYWYSTGSFSIGSDTGTVSYDPTDTDVELRVTNKLSVGTNTSGNIVLNGGGTGALTYIKIGTGDFGVAKFYADGNGKFSLQDKLKFTPGVGLEIDGSGTFSGSITAASGNIGGFTIGSASLYGGSGSNFVGIIPGSVPFFAGATANDATGAKFKVTNSGVLTATGATISGAITATSGSFTGDVKVDVGGKLYAGALPTEGQRIVIDNTGLYGFNSGNISVFSLPSSGTPTIANFKILENAITSDGQNANIIAGNSTDNITIRGDKTGSQAAAIYSRISGTITTATSGNGFYIDDTGKFRFASGTNSISGSNGSLNVTGTITGSSIIGNQITGGSIRGSDVFARSAQLGGSEYGWIAGSGELYSGTLGSTFFLQSGFWSNPVRSMVQGGGVTLSTTDQPLNRTISTPTGKISTSPRTNVLSGVGTNFIASLSFGYTVMSGGNIIGIVSRVIDNNNAILQSPSPIWVDNAEWSSTKYITTVTLHYFNDSSADNLVSVENAYPSGYSFVGGIIRSTINAYTFTVDCIPKQSLPYAKESGFLTTFTGSENDLVFELKNVYSSVVANSATQEENFYNVYIVPTNETIKGIEDLNIGDNIYLENIPSDTNTFYPLNNGYYPIISFVDNNKAVVSKATIIERYSANPSSIYGYGVLVYADGYLNYLDEENISTYPTTVERTKTYEPFAVSSVSARAGVITIKTTNANNLVVGQNVNVYGFTPTPYLSGDFQGTYPIASIGSDNKSFTYELTFPDLAETDISAFAKSLPTMKRKNYDKNYALWVGSPDPATAPLSIDPYGNKLKVKDLEVTGEVTGFYSDIIELDDFSGAFNGKKNSFYPTYNYKRVEVNNPLSMVLSLNGVVQSAFIRNREYVWSSHFLAYDGVTIDDLGRIKFSQSPPTGSRVNARLFPGPKNNKIVRKYPFKPVDIALG